MSDLSESERYLAAALAACRRAGEIHREHFRTVHLQVELKKDASPVTVADRGSEEAIREILHRATPELGLLGEEFGQEGSERDRWIIDPIDATRNFVAGLPFFATLIGLELDGELVLGAVHAPVLGPGSGLSAGQATGESAILGETWWAARGEGAWGGTGTVLETLRQRRLRVSEVSEIEQAFLVHGGLNLFQRQGFWPAFSEVVARANRTRGFGDWWGHVLVAEGRCDAMLEGQVSLHDVAALKPILEEAGGVLLTRGDTPLVTGWQDAAFSCNRNLAEELRQAMEY
ncbi:MAG TPA: inositol monophosphatase family protein [Thermoanaerobaculia bacterium]|jgi:histidinol-phosphatase|nr:inositol monophosphatase family protein [Thermoanaerobaculia bacterium]